jgi:hypothetical protein
MAREEYLKEESAEILKCAYNSASRGRMKFMCADFRQKKSAINLTLNVFYQPPVMATVHLHIALFSI